ncbi:MAG: peptidoglycan DD-metalloendopeptidase family protein [Pseudomonadota bacterium]|nr:peptidoglycan DD-metalloendopeptidase family protein [Pseudomonadota bacterium]
MRILNKLLGALTVVACLIGLAGCVGLEPGYKSNRAKEYYVVQKGDTLYSIAFRYGMDYKSLAKTNGIKPPYTIYLNQKLSLKNVSLTPLSDSGPNDENVSRDKIKKKKAKVAKKQPSKSVGWSWPLHGEVLNKFSLSQPMNKGIDIAGKKDLPVLAAADGDVVYAGGNLRGYGKLVILKHENGYLSAYGNNEVILVKEGDFVSTGSIISRVGRSASGKEFLHFEIRRDGKPVNPLRFLPKK